MEKTMKTTSQDELKDIISDIKEKQPDINSIYFVGCGASLSELYGGKYFLQQNAKRLQAQLINANEFNYAKPASADEHSIAIIASLGGTTTESIHAVENAKKWGCHTISVTHEPTSGLTKDADYVVTHGFFESYAAKTAKQKVVLGLALESLEAFEGYEYYDNMRKALDGIDDVINTAASNAFNQAKEFGEAYKDEDLIYTLASGASYGTGYSTANFIFMEMQWIASPLLDSAEYFHGPFEMTNKDTPYLLFMNDGSTRHLDARALEFLQRFEAKYTVIDAKDYGLDAVADEHVIDYFNPFILTGVMRVYLEQLAIARKHPYTKRQYMWKLEDY
ncbi:SIS domain-containing protein [Lactobacillaceae bacterium Melli_B4]